VLRYLPTNLSTWEIAGELYLSMNTVKTHQHHLYRKLDIRTRAAAPIAPRLRCPASRA
jgi:LuxR family maltose regulon positive regulatory protein